MSAPDDYTVVISLKTPDANFLHQVASYHQGQIVKKEAVEKAGDQYQLNPIGTGPFMLDHFTQNSEIVLNRFDDYYKGPAKLKRVTYRIIKDDNTAEIALKSQEVDLAGRLTDNTVLKRLVNDNRLTMNKITGYAVNITMFNTEFEPFSKVQSRRAFAHAIDRDAVIQAVAPLTDVRADNMLPDWMDVAAKDVPKYAYDPARAKALLAEAGYPEGFSFSSPASQLAAAPRSRPSASELSRRRRPEDGLRVRRDDRLQPAAEQWRLPACGSSPARRQSRHDPLQLPPSIEHSAKGLQRRALRQPQGHNAPGRPARPSTKACARTSTARRRRSSWKSCHTCRRCRKARTGGWNAVKGVAINKLANVDFWPVWVEA